MPLHGVPASRGRRLHSSRSCVAVCLCQCVEEGRFRGVLWAAAASAFAALLFSAGFLFFYFLFSFFIKIYFRFQNLQEYTPAALLPGPGRPAAGRQGFFCKNFREEFALKPLEDRSPDSGAAGPPSRPAAGRQASPGQGVGCPHPLICLTKNPEKKKKEGGTERGEALPDFRAGDCR